MKSSILTVLLLFFFKLLAFSVANGTEPFPKNHIAQPKFDTDPKKTGGQGGGDEDGDEEEDEDEEALSDTLVFRSLGDIIWNINDSLANIPAYDLYCDWNTHTIHPYKFDILKRKDTTLITLQEHECDYAHPVEGYVTSNFRAGL